MNLYIWANRISYLAIAHANSVSEARELILKTTDLGESGDGTCPEYDKARMDILNANPSIFRGGTAEFYLSDSAQLREAEGKVENLRQQIYSRDRRIEEIEATWKYLLTCRRRDVADELYAAADLLNGTPALDVLLAQARREALEAAADRARENGKVYSTPLMTEDELRRMAREAKP